MAHAGKLRCRQEHRTTDQTTFLGHLREQRLLKLYKFHLRPGSVKFQKHAKSCCFRSFHSGSWFLIIFFCLFFECWNLKCWKVNFHIWHAFTRLSKWNWSTKTQGKIMTRSNKPIKKRVVTCYRSRPHWNLQVQLRTIPTVLKTVAISRNNNFAQPHHCRIETKGSFPQ